MKSLKIQDKLINVNKIHFVRRESSDKIIISFGTDFVRVADTPSNIEKYLNLLETEENKNKR